MTIENKTVKSIMTQKPVCINTNTIMTEIALLFDTKPFHHLPVEDPSGEVVGVLSASDYLQLQDEFTRFNHPRSEMSNKKLFRSLIAADIMTKNPILIEEDTRLKDVIELFMDNKYHCLIVTKNKRCNGIITPFDIMKYVNNYIK